MSRDKCKKLNKKMKKDYKQLKNNNIENVKKHLTFNKGDK